MVPTWTAYGNLGFDQHAFQNRCPVGGFSPRCGLLTCGRQLLFLEGAGSTPPDERASLPVNPAVNQGRLLTESSRVWGESARHLAEIVSDHRAGENLSGDRPIAKYRKKRGKTRNAEGGCSRRWWSTGVSRYIPRVGKAPPAGLEPATRRLTAACSTD